MAAPSSRLASPPSLPDELVEEILLRLPPDDPACLLRASAVCQTWSSAVSHPSFRRRIHELHRTPPVLGFLHDWCDERVPDFVPTTASAFSFAAPDRRFWQPLDCRHGRALFLSTGEDTNELLLWEPITGHRQRVSVPAEACGVCRYPDAAVFCAADACDHRDCHGGPFRVVFVFTVEYESEDDEEEYCVTSACVYSSVTGAWGELTSTQVEFAVHFEYYSSVLVGRSLLYFMSVSNLIVEYDCARHSLRVFETPEESGLGEGCTLMLADDGGLGVNEITEDYRRLRLWSRDAGDGTDVRWVLSRVIHLQNLLPIGALANVPIVLVLGFAEGANAIFLNTTVGLFMIEVQSERVRKVCDDRGACLLIPVVSFYTPVARNKHQNLPLSNATEVTDGEEERGEEEKTSDQVQQVFDNGSNAIKEETSSMPSNVSAMNSTTEFHHREKLLWILQLDEAQEATGPLGDVSLDYTNDEESLKNSATGSKDEAGNSKDLL
ncbi:unnamed protein product [Alopecurus aequalis]